MCVLCSELLSEASVLLVLHYFLSLRSQCTHFFFLSYCNFTNMSPLSLKFGSPEPLDAGFVSLIPSVCTVLPVC